MAKQASKQKNVGLCLVVKRKVKVILGRHPALVAGSVNTNTDKIYSHRPRYKNGVTSNVGFTLVELSIVLVIIGLIAGGILLGKDLITAAEIRYSVSQMQQMEISYNTFKIKYNCVVGDCQNATDFFGIDFCPLVTNQYSVSCNHCNGDGDGLVKNTNGDGTQNCEYLNTPSFFVAANLLPQGMKVNSTTISGGYNGSLLNIMNDDWGSYMYGGTRTQYNGIISYKPNNYAGASASSSLDAQAIDSKIDDGIGNKGKFWGLTTIGVAGAGVCQTSGVYNTSANGECRFVYYFK